MIFESIIRDPLCVGDLRKIVVKKRPGATVLWHSSDPNDFLNVPLHVGEIVLVVDVEYPYVKVVSTRGTGWVYAEDTMCILRHS